MATPQRLPIVNSDDGTWGDIIRQYLLKEHYDDGTDNAVNGGHKTITIRAGTATAGTAPLKFTSGTVLTTPEAGAVEFNSDTLYFTATTGPTRKKIAAYDDSSGATGDVYYRDSSGNFVRLAIGATGQALRVTSGLPAWGSVNSAFPTNTQTSNYTILTSDMVILADATSGNLTMTLPTAVGTTNGYTVKKIDSSSNTVTIATTSSQTIDGGSTAVIRVQYASISVVSNGSNWLII